MGDSRLVIREKCVKQNKVRHGSSRAAISLSVLFASRGFFLGCGARACRYPFGHSGDAFLYVVIARDTLAHEMQN